MQVSELMQREVVGLKRDDSLDTLVRALDESPQDIFPVVDARGRVVGSVSEQDLIQILAPSRRTFPFGPRKLAREGLMRDVEDIMTPRPSTARPDEPVETALKRMNDLRLPQLVVVDADGRLLGLLRGRDVYLARFRAEP